MAPGGAISAVLLIAFLVGGTQLINTAESSIVVSLILCGVAIAIRRIATDPVFAAQLALSMAGQALFTFDVADRSAVGRSWSRRAYNL